MSMSPVGKLIYGYALGGTEDGPLIAEVDEDGEWQTEWAIALRTDPERKHEDPDPFEHLVDILRADGLNAGDSYTDGVTLILANHGHLEYGHCHALVTYECEAEWSETEPVDLVALEARRAQEGWDHLLAQAVKALGITPVEIAKKDDRRDFDAPRVPVPPRWMVVAQYI